MKTLRITAILLVCGLFTQAAAAQERIVLGGSKAVLMVIDSAYLFPGIGSRIVASARGDQGLGIFMSAIDPGFASKPVFDMSAGAEVYASFKPDLVIMKSPNRKTLGPPLTALGISQLYLNLETPEDYFTDIAALGKVFGEEARAGEVIGFYREKMNTVAERIGTVPANSRPRVLVVQAASPSEGVWEVPPAGWMQTRLVELSGGVPIWKDANPGSGWGKVNPEQIAAWNPDVVFVISYRGDPSQAAAAFREDGRLASVKAVQGARVYGFAKDFYSWDQPDTRWIIGLQWMAARMYPNLFPGYSATESAKDFFGFCYGMGSDQFKKSIAPKLSGDMGTKAVK
jgi:iron complex transport system substrate-binding protein